MTDLNSNFDDIRCYRDDEVAHVLRRLSWNKDLVHALLSLRISVFRHLPWLAYLLVPFVGMYLRWRTLGMDSVKEFQMSILYPYLVDNVKQSCSALTQSGLKDLDKNQAYLLVGNHRDILFEPMSLNLCVAHADRDTLRFAVGENLMAKAYADMLFRLNKCIKVRRHFDNSREAFKWHRHFANYLFHSVNEERCSLWIAQANGRAKDGQDKTDPGLIKMLTLPVRNQSKQAFSERINQLNIVPVSISYEYDPCDVLKAREFIAQERQVEKYTKEFSEDRHSMANGVLGWKGHVHVACGSPLCGDYDSPEAVATALDNAIVGNYVLFPSNYFAYHALYNEYPEGDCYFPSRPFDVDSMQEQGKLFTKHIAKVPSQYRNHVLQMYANPLRCKLSLQSDLPIETL